MKFIISLLLLQAFSLSAENLSYDDISLSWTQFRKVSKLEGRAAALIAINNKQSIQIENSKTLHFTTLVDVDQNLSKVDKSILSKNSEFQNNILLEHEKGHLVISLYYNYLLADSIQKRDFYRKENVNQSVRQIIQHFDQLKNNTNLTYDNETEHHINQIEQKKWDEKILGLLGKYVSKNRDIKWNITISKKLL